MSRAEQNVDESLVVAGSSSLAVMERIRIAMRDVEGYSVASPSSDVLQLARSTRKLGRRRASSCTVRVASDPRGLVVTLHGNLDPDHLELVRGAVLGRSVEDLHGAAVDSFRPQGGEAGSGGFVPPDDWFVGGSGVGAAPAPARPSTTTLPMPAPTSMVSAPAGGSTYLPPPTDDKTVHRSQSRPTPHPTQPPRRVVLFLADGRQFEVADLMLLGRAPTPRPTETSAPILVRVDDPELSKTHLSLGRHGDQVWIEDRNSTNGTQYVDDAGRLVAVVPNERLTVAVPASIVVGDTTLSLTWGG